MAPCSVSGYNHKHRPGIPCNPGSVQNRRAGPPFTAWWRARCFFDFFAAPIGVKHFVTHQRRVTAVVRCCWSIDIPLRCFGGEAIRKIVANWRASAHKHSQLCLCDSVIVQVNSAVCFCCSVNPNCKVRGLGHRFSKAPRAGSAVRSAANSVEVDGDWVAVVS